VERDEPRPCRARRYLCCISRWSAENRSPSAMSALLQHSFGAWPLLPFSRAPVGIASVESLSVAWNRLNSARSGNWSSTKSLFPRRWYLLFRPAASEGLG
jgi:hypothetical protein